jgi:hypothetical protein
MTITEQFKTAILNGNFKEAMLLAISQAFELNITTTINGEEQSKLQTEINLVEGTINNQIDPTFLKQDSHPLLEEMHFSQVNFAHEMMSSHVENWHQLLQFLARIEKFPSTIEETEITTAYAEEYTAERENPEVGEEEEWSEFLEEVETVTPTETIREDDWGDWMEEEEEENSKANKRLQ